MIPVYGDERLLELARALRPMGPRDSRDRSREAYWLPINQDGSAMREDRAPYQDEVIESILRLFTYAQKFMWDNKFISV